MSKTLILFLSFETLVPPAEDIKFIDCHGKSLEQIQKEIKAAPSTSGRRVVFIDTLHPLLDSSPNHVAPFLSSIMSPTSSVFAICHADVPFTVHSPYAPEPLALLKYLATTILTVHSLAHVLAKKKARDKSLAEPVFGLEEGVSGLVIGLGSNDPRGTVIEMIHRRKSGRSIEDWFFVYDKEHAGNKDFLLEMSKSKKTGEGIMLLQDHPEYPHAQSEGNVQGEEEPQSTFSLGITDKEKQSRDAISLPYFDAQMGDGIGEGGRILYDMGEEDDFDDEEDEI
jgi:elongator complex protein 5